MIKSRIVYIICLIGALGGLLFGLDQGFIANSLATIRKTYTLTLAQSEHYSAVLAYGGIFGALLAGLLARFLGRKKLLVLTGFFFSLLSLISALLPPFPVLVACRFGLGVAIGVATFTVPLYLSETAPTSVRGGMATLFQVMITIGIFMISVINVSIVKWLGPTPTSLSFMFTAIIAFSVLMFISSLFLPESPRWLILTGKHTKALKALAVLRRLYSSEEDVNTELERIEKNVITNTGFFSMLFSGRFLKVLLFGIVLQMFQQLVGINVMIYYAPTIFGYAGMTGVLALLLIPTVNMIFTFPAIKWIDQWGRRKLLYFGSTIMLLSMLAAGFSFLLLEHTTSKIIPDTILLIAAVSYIFGFACSWGPVVWVLCAEIFPLEEREIGMTITTMVNWTFSGIVLANALTLMKIFGNASIFFLFAGFCFLSLFFLRFFAPETKGVSLEEIEKQLKAGRKLKFIGKGL